VGGDFSRPRASINGLPVIRAWWATEVAPTGATARIVRRRVKLSKVDHYTFQVLEPPPPPRKWRAFWR
jgi:hypothetical protein